MNRHVRTSVPYILPWVALVLLAAGWAIVSNRVVPQLIEDAYAGRSLAAINGIIKDHDRPLAFYLDEWRDRRSVLFWAILVSGGAFTCAAANTATWLRRQAAAQGGLRPRQLDRALLWLTVAAAACLLLVMAFPALTGNVYLYDDLGVLHLPLRTFYASALRAGDDPTWCPSLFCGFYLHGEGQAGMLHPVKLALYRFLPLDAAFDIDVLLAYPLAFAGGYLLLRRWRLHPGAAAVGAFTFAFSAHLALRLNHTNVIQVLAHIPWLLLCTDVVLRGAGPRGRLAAQAGIALLTASQLLLGYPPSVWYSWLIEALYAIGVCIGQRRFRGLLVLGACQAMGAALAAIQLLPTAEMVPLSQRANPSLEYKGGDSLDPWNYAQLFSPYVFQNRSVGPPRPWEFGVYAGVAAPLLLLWLVGRRVPGRHRTLVWFALVLVLLGATLALGRYLPVFPWLANLPVIGLFRCWCRYTVLIYVGLSIAVAVAVDALLRRRRPAAGASGADRVLISIVAAVVLGYAALGGLALAGRAGLLGLPLGSPAAMAVGPVLLLAALGLLRRASCGGHLALLGLVFLHLTDVCLYDASYLFARCRFDRLENFAASIDLPPGSPRTRLQSGDNAETNLPLIRDLPLVGGLWGGLTPRRSLDYEKTAGLQLAGAGWRRGAAIDGQESDVVLRKSEPGRVGPEKAGRHAPARKDMNEIALLRLNEETAWEPVPDPLPWARLVTRAVVSKEPAREIERLDCRTTAVVAGPVGLCGGTPGTATVLARRNGEALIRTEGSGRQLLVVAESYHPGWTVAIDGRPGELVRVYGDFMGCVVEDGQHEVCLQWRPESLRRGIAVSILGALLLVLWIGGQTWHTRRSLRVGRKR
jgi:hypothetical protein